MDNEYEEKIYEPIDFSKNKRYASMEEHTQACYTPEEIEEIGRRNARMSCAHVLKTMRIKAGISQVVMAGAMGCRQPRISLIESSPNEKISMPTILKYVEVTGRTFDAELEDGKVNKVSEPRKKRTLTSRNQAVAS